METDEPNRYSLLAKFIFALVLLIPFNTSANTASLDSVETTVRNYFIDTPVMIEIARCESKFKQYETDGSPLYGGWQSGMVGVFQLFERVHLSGAKALGFQIDTLEGNLAYAKHLYNTSGTKPWNSSKACWGNAVTTVTSSKATKSSQSVEEKRAELIKQIAVLMKIIEARKKIALSN